MKKGGPNSELQHVPQSLDESNGVSFIPWHFYGATLTFFMPCVRTGSALE